MANYCKEEVGEGPDGSGHLSDSQGGGGSERHVMGGDASHCEGHVEGQLYFIDYRQTIKGWNRERLRSHPARLFHS